MNTLNYRRARFVYEGARLAAAAAEAPIVPEPYDYRELAFREQFERVIEKQMGSERSSNAERLHEEWVEAYAKMGWVYGPERDRERKTHPDMVPYAQLGHLERDKDAVFVALCEIARKWVHEPGADCDDEQELEKELGDLQHRHNRYFKAIGEAIGVNRARRHTGEPAQSDAEEIRSLLTELNFLRRRAAVQKAVDDWLGADPRRSLSRVNGRFIAARPGELAGSVLYSEAADLLDFVEPLGLTVKG